MEEKINQILKNQVAIMNTLGLITDSNFQRDRLKLAFDLTNKLLNPTKQPSIAERTHDAFSKVEE